jgi:hypothetical protein
MDWAQRLSFGLFGFTGILAATATTGIPQLACATLGILCLAALTSSVAAAQ